MTGSNSGRFSLKSICLLMCMLIGFSYAFVFYSSQDVYAAGTAGTIKVSGAGAWGDEGGFNVDISGFGKGNVTVVFEFNCSVSLSCSGPATIVSDGGQTGKVKFTGWGGSPNGGYYINVSGTDLPNTLKVSIKSKTINVTPTAKPKPTNTTAPINTNTTKPTNTKAPATSTPKPTATKKPATSTPKPTATKAPATSTPKPTATKKPATSTPKPTATKAPATSTPKPTATKKPVTSTPKPTATK
ncbi:MAG: hypothetical protein IKT10_01620, partial [Clostridiales bacterium]|nr:hypothetical protein [Clostridiales bacterium]